MGCQCLATHGVRALSERIYSDAVWLSARELSEKASFKNTKPGAGPNRWKSSGSIFAVQISGKVYYPRYLLDEGDGIGEPA